MHIKKGMTGILSMMLAFSAMFSNVTTLYAEEPDETAAAETAEEPAETVSLQMKETIEDAEETAEAAEEGQPEETAEELEEIPEFEQKQTEEETVPEETAEEISTIAETEYGTADAGTGTNDELLQMYLDKQLNIDGQENAEAQGMGDALTGNNLIVYRILRSGIEQAAAGEITSTVFSITLEDLGLYAKMWTAEDLGIDTIAVDNQITDAAMNALVDLVGIDMPDIMSRLLVDCPYDLYWFDKTKGYKWQFFSFGAGKLYDEWVLYLRGEYTVSLTAANEYAADKYQTDPAVISSVSTAVSAIRDVVQSHASERDYDKLVSYRQDICSRVSYNDDAAGNPSTPYGNPWQLIWVFDGDDTTNVVCEGYAKAFKYLCDLSVFRSSSVDCYLVTGTMDGGTGAGNHMWNIVTMDDSKNYLVDVTNCDEGSIGEDDWLFLTGVEYATSNSFNVVIPERTIGNVIYTSAVITYKYDSRTRDLYDSSLLELSAVTYVPEVVPVSGVILDQHELVLEKGTEAQLTATVMPADAGNKTIIWTSSDTAVATVDSTGIVTAVGKGTSTIAAITEDGAFTDICYVTVEEHIRVTGVRLDHAAMTIEKGTEAQLTATVMPADADNKNAVWTSSNTDAVTVDDTGKVTAVDKGRAVITVTTEDGNKTAQCIMTVLGEDDYSGIYVKGVKASYTYTGTAVKPEFEVYDTGTLLVTKTDYTVTYKNNTKAYTLKEDDPGFNAKKAPQIIIKSNSKGNYKGTKTVYFSIEPVNIETDERIYIENEITLKGTTKVQRPVPVITFNGKTVSSKEYTLTYLDSERNILDKKTGPKAAGTYTILITGKDKNFTGTTEVSLTISDTTIKEKTVALSRALTITALGAVYDGTAKKTASVTFKGGYVLTEGTDYTIAYSNNTKAGTATVTATGKGIYTGTVKKTFKIAPLTYLGNEDQFTIEAEDAVYSKGGAIPEVHVTWNGTELVKGTDYTLKYANNKKVTDSSVSKWPTATITFKGNFKGTDTKDFLIDPKPINTISITSKDKVYSSKANAWKSAPVLKDTDGKTLKAGTDYNEITYTTINGKELPAVVEAGTVVKVTVTGAGNYTDTATTTYRILETGKDISKATFKIAAQEYTGSEIRITDMSQFTETKGIKNAYITVNKQKEYLVLGEDFEVVPGSYVKNVNKGTAKVTFRGIYPYGGEKTVTFRIEQKIINKYWEGLKGFFSKLF